MHIETMDVKPNMPSVNRFAAIVQVVGVIAPAIQTPVFGLLRL